MRNRLSYDGDGYLQQLTSTGEGHKQTLRYLFDWNHHKIAEVTDQSNVTYQFEYDAQGNRKRQYDPAGIT